MVEKVWMDGWMGSIRFPRYFCLSNLGLNAMQCDEMISFVDLLLAT